MTAAAQLTEAILRPAPSRTGPAVAQRIRDRLAGNVPDLVAPLPPGEQIVVSVPILRQLASGGDNPTIRPDDPFAWKPAFVRRSLGLAAIDACLAGYFRAPMEAVGPVAERAVAEWERSGWRTFHWEPWYAGLGTGGRGAVLAEASNWATGVWASLDWGQFRTAPRLGGPDDQWVCPGPRTVRLKGRSEIRIDLPSPEPSDSGSGSSLRSGSGSGSGSSLRSGSGSGSGSTTQQVLVAVAGGSPPSGLDVQLGYLALVAALRTPTRPAPVRVVGLWPQTGEARTVEVTDELLARAGDTALDAVRAVVRTRGGSPMDGAGLGVGGGADALGTTDRLGTGDPASGSAAIEALAAA